MMRCTWGTDSIGGFENRGAVRGRGDIVAGSEKRPPKCTVDIGVFSGGGGTIARNEDRVQKCIESRNVVRGEGGVVLHGLGLTTDNVRNRLGRQEVITYGALSP